MTDLSGFCSFMKRDNLPNRSLSRTLPRIMSVILNLFQDLIILFIRLSLFVKYMRCRNKFSMTVRYESDVTRR